MRMSLIYKVNIINRMVLLEISMIIVVVGRIVLTNNIWSFFTWVERGSTKGVSNWVVWGMTPLPFAEAVSNFWLVIEKSWRCNYRVLVILGKLVACR